MVLCLIARRLDDDDDDDDDVDDVSLECRRDAFIFVRVKNTDAVAGLAQNSSSRRVSVSLNERCARDECEEHDDVG